MIETPSHTDSSMGGKIGIRDDMIKMDNELKNEGLDLHISIGLIDPNWLIKPTSGGYYGYRGPLSSFYNKNPELDKREIYSPEQQIVYIKLEKINKHIEIEKLRDIIKNYNIELLKNYKDEKYDILGMNYTYEYKEVKYGIYANEKSFQAVNALKEIYPDIDDSSFYNMLDYYEFNATQKEKYKGDFMLVNSYTNKEQTGKILETNICLRIPECNLTDENRREIIRYIKDIISL